MFGGKNMFVSSKVLGKEISAASDAECATAKEQFRAMCFLQCVDPGCYSELLDELRKGVLKGRDEFPKTVAAAYNLMLHMSNIMGYRRTRTRFKNGNKSGAPQSFVLAQKGDKATNNKTDGGPGRDRVFYKGIKCYACQELGHYSSQCPVTKETSNNKVGFKLAQNNDVIKESWMLLDTCSTVSPTTGHWFITYASVGRAIFLF